MFAQIFLGIYFIVIGVCHLLNVEFFISSNLKYNYSKEKVKSYQKGMALPYILLGFIFIGMGIVEKQHILPVPIFLGLYIILCIIPFILILRNNKKHFGSYWIR